MGRAGDVITTALAPLTWGTTYLITTELLPPDRPLLAGAIRALPVGLALLMVLRRLPAGSWWWRAAVLGALNIGLFFALLFVAAYRLPGGVAATVGAIGPLVVAGLSVPLLGLRATRVALVAGLVGVAGVALLVLRAGAHLDTAGVIAGLAATMCWALGTVLTKRWGRPVPLLVFTAWQLVAGGLLLAPLTLVVEGLPPALDGGAVAGYTYLAVVNTGLAYLLWFWGLDRLPAQAVSFLALLSPVVATAAGFLVNDETLTPLQLVGIALIFAGIVAGQRRAVSAAPQSLEATPTGA